MNQRFRLFPIVIVTALGVLGFKVADFLRSDAVSLSSINVALAQEKPEEQKPAEKKPADNPPESDAVPAEMKKDGKMAEAEKESQPPKEHVVTNLSQSQVAVLESLSKRRKELDEREKKLDLQMALLQAAEKRIDGKISTLEKIRDEIEEQNSQQKKLQEGKFKKLVSIYEGMKPKEAARILSRLDAKVVLQVAERIAPRKMSAILAKMDAEAAQRLTVQLAVKAVDESKPAKELPQIGSETQG